MTSGIEIVGYRRDLAADFDRLNREWLEKYFTVEPLDEEYLSDPEGHIVVPGGEVFFALDGGIAIGTCAAIPKGADEFELAKLAVTPAAQGRGLGRVLSERVIRFAREHGARRVTLVSNSGLVAALRLYESLGFAHAPFPFAPPYVDADVYMVLELGD
jgi:GNAT superfamily N-acetyltransferase